MIIDVRPEARFFSRIDFDGPDFNGEPCWMWTGAPNSSGYGRIVVAGSVVYAHRFSYELFVGRIPPRAEIDHLCRRRACVNPRHLEPVSPRTNRLRGVGPSAVNAAKQRCKEGHMLSGPNLVINSNGSRRCLRCKREYERRRYHAKKAS